MSSQDLSIVTFCTGFGLWDIGAKGAGLKLAGGVEIQEEVASVANVHFGDGHVTAIDLRLIDPSFFPRTYWFHVSPPCLSASNANHQVIDGVRETDGDISLARAIVRFIRYHRQDVISLENVRNYQKYQSFVGGDDFEGIVPALRGMGYSVEWQVMNSADYGVPQSRQRLIMVATLVGDPVFPAQTHEDRRGTRMASMFFDKWAGWHDVVADLLPDLLPAPFGETHLKRLPAELNYSFLTDTKNANIRDLTIRKPDEPAQTIIVRSAQENRYRIFLHSSHPLVSSGKMREGAYAVPMRAFARLQGIPDAYWLPPKKKLAAYGIGNGVPCELARQIVSANIRRGGK